MLTRKPAVAGTFYPADVNELRFQVGACLEGARDAREHQKTSPTYRPKALIVPHAGYVYSGPVAGYAYQLLESLDPPVERVVLLGPSHRFAFRGIASPGCDAFSTPMGTIPLAKEELDDLEAKGLVQSEGMAHVAEHSLEVQLPFLQMTLKDFRLLPLVVGDTEPEAVAALLEAVWGGPETLIVISSDLSHYHPYDCARIIDANTTREMEALHPVLGGEQACGCRPLNGLLLAALRHGLTLETLDLRNSGDTAGGRDRVVGYGAYALH